MRRVKMDGKYVHPDMLHLNKVNYICKECGSHKITQKVVLWVDPTDHTLDKLKDEKGLYYEPIWEDAYWCSDCSDECELKVTGDVG
jgi:DNA-directed RNA polymerase subunit RPC12/RpoP